MTETSKQKDSYWALAKYEVYANHFTPVYSFSYYRGKSKQHLAKTIADEFQAKIDYAMSFLEPDEDFSEDRAEIKKHFHSVLSRIKKERQSVSTPLTELETSITIGYPTHEFKIIAEGPWNEFSRDFLAALEDDIDFSDFLEQQAEEAEFVDESDTLSEEFELFAEYKRLKQMSSSDLERTDVSSFLNLVKEVVMNEVM